MRLCITYTDFVVDFVFEMGRILNLYLYILDEKNRVSLGKISIKIKGMMMFKMDRVNKKWEKINQEIERKVDK
jgi:hypothetical protein